ncbi:phosphatidylserine decarboxylase-domain-containing protein [Xylaria acuta]|nr:phosphatidylserine decarboxylase-domain-containing protein [Xylaria acuta]
MASIIHRVINYLLSWAFSTGDFMHEQQPLKKKLKLLLLFNPITEWIDRTHAMRLYIHRESLKAGQEESEYSSKAQTRGFVDAYGINMKDFDAYDSFRRLLHAADTRKESRPIHKPEDAITNLVMDTQLGARFDDGGRRELLAVAAGLPRLPRPRDGQGGLVPQSAGRLLRGRSHSPAEPRRHPHAQTPGIMLSSIPKRSARYGSSIIVAFQAGRIRLDDDLRDLSMRRIQTAVEVRMSVGSAV